MFQQDHVTQPSQGVALPSQLHLSISAHTLQAMNVNTFTCIMSQSLQLTHCNMSVNPFNCAAVTSQDISAHTLQAIKVNVCICKASMSQKTSAHLLQATDQSTFTCIAMMSQEPAVHACEHNCPHGKQKAQGSQHIAHMLTETATDSLSASQMLRKKAFLTRSKAASKRILSYILKLRRVAARQMSGETSKTLMLLSNMHIDSELTLELAIVWAPLKSQNQAMMQSQ